MKKVKLFFLENAVNHEMRRAHFELLLYIFIMIIINEVTFSRVLKCLCQRNLHAKAAKLLLLLLLSSNCVSQLA